MDVASCVRFVNRADSTQKKLSDVCQFSKKWFFNTLKIKCRQKDKDVK